MIWTPDGALVLPSDIAAGCLPSEDKVGSCASLFRENFDVLPLSECDRIIRERREAGLVQGKADVPEIHYQDGRGSCATDQTALAWEVTNKRMGRPRVRLNPWPTYYHTSGKRDTGSTLASNVKFGRERGFLPDEVWPRYREDGKTIHHDWDDAPPDELWVQAVRLDEAYQIHPDDYVREIATSLVEGFCVGVGWSGHSELMVEYEEGGEALVANSWGVGWNEDGFHHEPIRKANMGYDAFAYRINQQFRTDPVGDGDVPIRGR